MCTIDGCLVAFDGPAFAAHCAEDGGNGAHRLGLRTRAGLHAGEAAATGTGVAGVAVQLGARVAGQAEAGQVVVSSTVNDSVVGSGLKFLPLGDRVFSFLLGDWRLFRLATGAAPPCPTPPVPGMPGARRASWPCSVLSLRDRAVARLLARWLSNRCIADDPSISIGSVGRHVASILAKLGMEHRPKWRPGQTSRVC